MSYSMIRGRAVGDAWDAITDPWKDLFDSDEPAAPPDPKYQVTCSADEELVNEGTDESPIWHCVKVEDVGGPNHSGGVSPTNSSSSPAASKAGMSAGVAIVLFGVVGFVTWKLVG